MVAISVIVYCYNVEKYISTCINSILLQTFKDFEIICIDDNSDDNTTEYLKNYSINNNCFNILFNKIHKGIGFSYNYGLENAKGDYVLFLDASNWLDLNALELLYDKSFKSFDLLLFKSLDYNYDKKCFLYDFKFSNEFSKDYNNTLFNINDLKTEYLFSYLNNSWQVFYNKNFLINNNFRFLNEFTLSENLFFYNTIVNADNIFLIDNILVNRYVNNFKNDFQKVDYFKFLDYLFKIFFKNEEVYNVHKDRLIYYIKIIIKSIYLFLDDDKKNIFAKKADDYFKNLNYKYDLNENILNFLDKKHKINLPYFSVLGCCVSRDIFNSHFNPDYKKYFKIGPDGFKTSILSLMSEPLDYDEESIKLEPWDKVSKARFRWFKQDFEKTFLNTLKEYKFDYLIIDTYFDVDGGAFDFNDKKTFITDDKFLHDTKFYKNLGKKYKFSITKFPEKYFELWSKSCDDLFKFLDKYCPNTKIILNPSKGIFKIRKEDGEIILSEKFKEKCIKNNPYRELLDSYILNNFNVDVLTFNESVCLDENHKDGLSYVHYEKKYHYNMMKQLNDIIERDLLLQEFSMLNNIFKSIKRNDALSIHNNIV